MGYHYPEPPDPEDLDYSPPDDDRDDDAPNACAPEDRYVEPPCCNRFDCPRGGSGGRR